MKRLVGQVGDVTKWFAHEDGVHYRGLTHELGPVMERARFLSAKVNEAPARGNRNNWRYAGTVPISVITDWCWKNRIGFDQWARNEDGAKDKFLRWFQSEFSKLTAKNYQGARARPGIVVPSAYRGRSAEHHARLRADLAKLEVGVNARIEGVEDAA